MTGLVTLTSKNQLTLPVDVVRYFGWKPGVRLWSEIKEDSLVMKKAGGLRDVQGILANHPLSKKYSSVQIVHLARKKAAAQIANET